MNGFLANTVQTARTRLARAVGLTHGGDRDTWEQFGYPRQIEIQALWERYKRGGIEKRIIRAFSQATWRDDPIVEENDNREQQTEFERQVEQLNEQHGLWAMMERLDRLSAIGRFGCLLIGFNDSKHQTQPVERASEVIYLRPFSERSVSITQLDQDPKSPRFGLPLMYEIQTQDVDQRGARRFSVHYSRMLHVTEFPEEDDVYGTPRLEAIYNRLLDLEKVVGGSAEAFWLNANAGLAIMAQQDGEFTQPQREELKQQAEDYQHGFRRVMAMHGADVKQLAVQIGDPSNHANTILDQIAGTEGIPKRILTGSEQGELASSQDEGNWNARIEERRQQFAEPRMIRPLLEKLGAVGVLNVPERYWAYWQPIDTLDETKKSEIALRKSQALAAYSNAPQAAVTVPEREFREHWLGLEPAPEGGFVSEVEPLSEEDDPTFGSEGNEGEEDQ